MRSAGFLCFKSHDKGHKANVGKNVNGFIIGQLCDLRPGTLIACRYFLMTKRFSYRIWSHL